MFLCHEGLKDVYTAPNQKLIFPLHRYTDQNIMWLPSYHSKTNLIPEMELFFLAQDFEAIPLLYAQDLISIVSDVGCYGRQCIQIQY
jgi:hypothetical protein